METEITGLDLDIYENDDSNVRSKTSLRMHYEAQVSVIQGQVGALEDLRLNLGLSQRKMAQLLMVDPSSWTRWTKQGDEAPPHIWRALQWYLALKEKIPGLTPQYFLNQSPQVLHKKALQELDSERAAREGQFLNLQTQISTFSVEKSALQTQVDTLKKDLLFYKRMSIVILLLSISSGVLLFIGKFLL
jgi:transcriptional regulator with XRE-family HTH domain